MRYAWRLGFVLWAMGCVEAGAQRALMIAPEADDWNAVEATVREAGYPVERAGYSALTEAIPADVDLIVLGDAGRLPAAAVDSIGAYLAAGGDIVALGAPLWRDPLWADGDAWVTRHGFLETHGAELLVHPLFTFEGSSEDIWRRNTGNGEVAVTRTSVEDAPVPGGHGLQVDVAELRSWETIVADSIEQAFPDGDAMTVIFAKGNASTPSLMVEWTERDQSRWAAVLPLTETWRPYVLAPEDFQYWESVPARRATTFNPAEAMSLSIGLAHSHTHVGPAPYSFSVGPIGTAPRTAIHEQARAAFAPPAMELLSPAYKFYAMDDVAMVKTCGEYPSDVPVVAGMLAHHPRPSAGGFNKGRAWRWQPLLEAKGADGAWRGAPASVLVHGEGDHRGGVWMSFAVDKAAWYGQALVKDVLAQALQTMRRGAYLLDAGTNCYTYFEGQPVTLGARVVNVNPRVTQKLIVRIELQDPAQGGAVVHAYEERITCAPGETKFLSQTIGAPAWPEGGLQVVAILWDSTGRYLDRAVHEAHVWRPKADAQFVTVADGDFQLDGKRWTPHGVNYMPSSGIALSEWEPFEHWVGAKGYDPVVVQRDLERIRAMGMNAVSIFMYRQSMESQNVLDLLRRIDALGMKANLSLRPGTPLDFQWDAVREMIEFYKLAQNDTVFAYDLAWEPMFGNHDERVMHDADWRAWVVDRYGSVENAEADWGFAAPRDGDGQLTNPLNEHVRADGDWRVMVAAYRRFLDTLLYAKYSEARRLVRGIDPNHAVSFRMTEAGNPTFSGDRVLPYPWLYLSGAVDILEPEAYGRIGDWERVKPGWFQFEVARWLRPDAPMMWAEAGVSVWHQSMMTATEEQIQFQADYYEHFYRMLAGSGADGVFFWWYPGGYRSNEKSDYGIINPDGTDRPVTKVIRAHADEVTNGAGAKAVDTWITVDLDAKAEGLPAAYARVAEEFWKAIDEGKTPGLRSEGTGTTTATCPRVAVGNTALTGSNPPKHVDGFFDRVEVQGGDGARKVVVEVTNLNEAVWIAQGEGAVTLVATQGDKREVVALPRDVARFGSAVLEFPLPAAGEWVLRMEAEGIGAFGPRMTIVVE